MKLPKPLALSIALFGAASCDKIWIRPQAPLARVQEDTFVEPLPVSHRVTKGDTLFKIAKQYTGRGQNWKTIAAYNTGIKPGALKAGQEVIIPPSLLARNFSEDEIDQNPAFSYSRASLKTSDSRTPRARSLKQTSSQKIQKSKQTLALETSEKKRAARPQSKSTSYARSNGSYVSSPKSELLAKRNEPVRGDSPIAEEPAQEKLPEKAVEVVKAAPPPPPPVEALSERPVAKILAVKPIDSIEPPVIVKRKSERVITAKTRIQRIEPTAAPIIANKNKVSSSFHAKENALSMKEPKAQEQSSRSSFYSCMADKCSLHNF